MTGHDAADRIIARLEKFNRIEAGCGLPTLESADHTWMERVHELHMRVGALGAARHDMRPSMSDLESLGAWVVATMIAVDEAERVDVASGDMEAAA